MALQRWPPFREELFPSPERFRRPSAEMEPGYSFPIDVSETDDEFVVRASLPGFQPEDIFVDVKDDVLTIRAKRAHEEERRGERWLLRESRMGTYYRVLELPASINADQARADYVNGMLTLTLPKVEKERATRLRVGEYAKPRPIQETKGTVETGALPTTSPAGYRSAVKEGMEVVGSDGYRIGTVKEVRGNDFLVNRSLQRDVYVPYEAIREVANGKVMLDVPSGQLDSMNWPHPALTGGNLP